MELFICSFVQPTSAGHDILGTVRALGHRCEKDSCVYSWNLDAIKKIKNRLVAIHLILIQLGGKILGAF